MLRSWLALKGREDRTIEVPDDVADVIEGVYGDQESPTSSKIKLALADAKDSMAKDQFDKRAEAGKRRVAKPGDEELLWNDNLELEEDNPSVHEYFQALTRSDRPGLSVICLHRINGKLHLDPDDSSPIYEAAEAPDKRLVLELARRAISIRRPQIEKHLLSDAHTDKMRAILARWRRIAALRYHKVVVFENGVCPLAGTPYTLRLDKESQLGLQICKEAQ